MKCSVQDNFSSSSSDTNGSCQSGVALLLLTTQLQWLEEGDPTIPAAAGLGGIEGGREIRVREEGGREEGRKGGRGLEGREGGGAESASPVGVEFRLFQVKVAVCCRVHAAPVPSCCKSVSSPGCVKKEEWKLERDSRGRQVLSRRHQAQVVLRQCQSSQQCSNTARTPSFQRCSRVNPSVGKTLLQ